MKSNTLKRIIDAEDRVVPKEYPLYVWYDLVKESGKFKLTATVCEEFGGIFDIEDGKAEPVEVIEKCFNSTDDVVVYVREFRHKYHRRNFSNVISLHGDFDEEDIDPLRHIGDGKTINGHLLI